MHPVHPVLQRPAAWPRGGGTLPRPAISHDDAIRAVADFLTPNLVRPKAPDIVAWAENNFYIPETRMPVTLEPLQKTWLRWAATSGMSNLLYSTVKKSGKTAINGMFSRYRTEYSGDQAEVYFIANAEKQAKDRAYSSAVTSIEKTPGFHKGRRELPGQWRIIERYAVHIPTGSKMQSLTSEYESAAGGNPTLTSWTELWAFTGERNQRLWDELTPVPTREISQRLVETYAGFVDESALLWNLYTTAVRKGHRLTKDELCIFAGSDVDPWPYDDEPRFFINEAASTFAYWDEGDEAQRRMPWQRGERGRQYYMLQATTERSESYERLHRNKWVSSKSDFIKPEWWMACRKPLPHALPSDWPVVVAVDGSVNSDCTAVVGVCREPVAKSIAAASLPGVPTRPSTIKYVASDTDIRVAFSEVWVPPRGGVIDLDDVEAYLRVLCGHGRTLSSAFGERAFVYADKWSPVLIPRNVVCVTYDQYQLHQMMTRLENDFIAWPKPFSQAGEREIADKQLYDLIIRRGISHNNEFDSEYMSNAAAYTATEAAKNQNRLRIVKKSPDAKVDPVVALSMATRVCLWLLLD